MTLRQKNEIIAEVVALLDRIIIVDDNLKPQISVTQNNVIEMLTIKECTEIATGLSEHTIRQLVKQNKIKSVRTGTGQNGKILICKSSLLEFLNGTAA